MENESNREFDYEDGIPDFLLIKNRVPLTPEQEEAIRRRERERVASGPRSLLSRGDETSNRGMDTRTSLNYGDNMATKQDDTTETKPETGSPAQIADAAEVNYVARYNQMVKEALDLGLNAKGVERFPSSDMAIKRCTALASSIKAARASKKAADAQEKGDTMATSTAKKKAPSARKAKTKTSARKAVKSKTARKAVKGETSAAPKEKRAGIVGVFGTREGTNREKLLLKLEASGAKGIAREALAKHIYGDADSVGSMMAVLKGLEMMIDDGKLSYEVVKHEDGNIALKKK